MRLLIENVHMTEAPASRSNYASARLTGPRPTKPDTLHETHRPATSA